MKNRLNNAGSSCNEIPMGIPLHNDRGKSGKPAPSSVLVIPIAKPVEPDNRAERHTTAREHLAEQIWHGVAQAIIMTDGTGKILCANPAFLTMMQAESESTVTGTNIQSFLEQSSQLDGMIARMHKCCICSKRVTMRPRGTHPFPAQVTASPILDEDGRLRNIIFSMEDASLIVNAEKLQKQAGLAAINQARLAAIAELGYALNDPLQTLLSLSEEEDRPECRDQITKIIQIVRKFYSEYEARIDSGASPETIKPAKPESTDITPCVADAVLVADDEPMIRKLFERMLSDAFPELKIDLAEDGKQAVEAFADRHHNVIFMDIMMPGMRGDDAYKKIMELCKKRRWELPHCIFCTGFMPSDTLKTLAADARHKLLRKPVSRRDIMAVMGNFLKNNQIGQT